MVGPSRPPVPVLQPVAWPPPAVGSLCVWVLSARCTSESPGCLKKMPDPYPRPILKIGVFNAQDVLGGGPNVQFGLRTSHLGFCYSKCSPWTGSTSLLGELVRNTESQFPPRLMESESTGQQGSPGDFCAHCFALWGAKKLQSATRNISTLVENRVAYHVAQSFSNWV